MQQLLEAARGSVGVRAAEAQTRQVQQYAAEALQARQQLRSSRQELAQLAQQQEVLKFGVADPLTGPSAIFGLDQIQAVRWAIEDINAARVGMLAPEYVEEDTARVEVRELFKVPKIGVIAGCYVQDGKVIRTAHVRLLRDNVVIHTGKVSSLKRFKDDAGEVKAGLECGIGIAGYNDVKPGDVIEFFTTEKVKETLQ